VGHLTNTGAMAGYAKSRGLPAARPAVLVTGVQIAIGALLVLLGVWMDLGLILLALFLLGTAVLIHNFWRDSDPSRRFEEQLQFMKDLSLAGAAIALLAAVWIIGDDLGLTITGPLLNP
jgi:putative oxidoreductase